MTKPTATQVAKSTGLAILMMATLTASLHAASATALVSVRILGHADQDVAQGAVTLSKVPSSGFEGIEVPRSGRVVEKTISSFRVGGGRNATFAVALPETVAVHNGGSVLSVGGFRTSGSSGRLGDDGNSTIGVGAEVRVPAGQQPGQYAGSFPITIAYN